MSQHNTGRIIHLAATANEIQNYAQIGICR